MAKLRSSAQFGEVVEEDAAHAPLLVAVLEEEVLVAPLLEARVVVVAERLRVPLCRWRWKCTRVFLEAVDTASGPCRRRTSRYRAPCRSCRWPWPACARSCGPWAHAGCAGGTPATRPWPRRVRRRARAGAAVAEGGSCGPRTCEKPQPARSNKCTVLEDQRQLPWPPAAFRRAAFSQASRQEAAAVQGPRSAVHDAFLQVDQDRPEYLAHLSEMRLLPACHLCHALLCPCAMAAAGSESDILRRNCMPSNWMLRVTAHRPAAAPGFTLSASTVTHNTRPPEVTTLPSTLLGRAGMEYHGIVAGPLPRSGRPS